MLDYVAIRIMLAGSDETGMERLRRELIEAEGIAVCAEVADGDELMAAAGAFSPDIIVVLADSLGPRVDGQETVHSISEAGIAASVILVAEKPISYLISAVKSGIAGLLPTQMVERELVSLVRKVHVWSARPVPV